MGLTPVTVGSLHVLLPSKANPAGPGTVVGERASLEDGRRTADLRALTEARVAEAAPGLFSAEQLSELARGRHREDCRRVHDRRVTGVVEVTPRTARHLAAR